MRVVTEVETIVFVHSEAFAEGFRIDRLPPIQILGHFPKLVLAFVVRLRDSESRPLVREACLLEHRLIQRRLIFGFE